MVISKTDSVRFRCLHTVQISKQDETSLGNHQFRQKTKFSEKVAPSQPTCSHVRLRAFEVQISYNLFRFIIHGELWQWASSRRSKCMRVLQQYLQQRGQMFLIHHWTSIAYLIALSSLGLSRTLSAVASRICISARDAIETRNFMALMSFQLYSFGWMSQGVLRTGLLPQSCGLKFWTLRTMNDHSQLVCARYQCQILHWDS